MSITPVVPAVPGFPLPQQTVPPRLLPSPEQIEHLSSAMTTVSKAAIGLGALTTLAYVFQISSIPTGLTAGDVLFLAYIALAAAAVYLVLILYGSASILWAMYLIYGYALALRYRKQDLEDALFLEIALPLPSTPDWRARLKESCRKNVLIWKTMLWWRGLRLAASRTVLDRRYPVPTFLRGWSWAILSVFLFLTFLSVAIVIGSTEFYELLLASWLAGFVTLIFFSADNLPPGLSRHGRLLGLVLITLLILCMYAGASSLLNIVFQSVGVRKHNVTMELPLAEIDAVRRIEAVVGYPIIDCKLSSPDRVVVHGADVLWTGIGSHTIIQFGPAERAVRTVFQRRERPTRLGVTSFKSETVRLIESTPHTEACFDIPSELLFQPSATQLNTEGEQRVTGAWHFADRLGNPQRIHITGFSSSDPGMDTADTGARVNALVSAFKTFGKPAGAHVTSPIPAVVALKKECPKRTDKGVEPAGECEHKPAYFRVEMSFAP